MTEPAVSRSLATPDAAPPSAPHSESTAIISMIERAARDPNVDVSKMERLFEMQERALARNAKAAFTMAFAEMQPKLPVIAEKGKGDKNATYALWEDVNDAIKPVLAEHGFGISFKTGRTPDRVTVTAILMHREGHSEETTLELPVDTSGSKNAVQAVGSSTSYGKRYTAMALLNLTSRLKADRDDDGRGAGAPVIDDVQAERIRKLATEARADIGRFLAFFRVESIPDIPAARFDEAVRALESKRAGR